MESNLITVVLKPGEADRVIAGHPWVYAGSILKATHPPEDGSVVQVKDHRQRLLGVGFFNSKSKIQVRMLAGDRVEVNRAFFEDRIRAALDVRRRHQPEATSYRVVNSESDLLSGLIIDKYEDVLVVQTSSLGMDRRKADIVAALQKIFSPRAILERNDSASRKFEGLEASNGVLADHHYLAAAVGIAPADVAPVSGLYFGDRKIPHRLETKLEISRRPDV
jgi:23S rRNA (cytosine1962-C5)-methyltransferase